MASLQPSDCRIQKLVELMERLATKSHISLAEMQKAAGKLRFAQTMAMGRFGKAAMRPLYELIAQGGGPLTPAFLGCLRRRGQTLPNIAPRAIKAPQEGSEGGPSLPFSC